jgi:hypothetical protein
VVEVTCLDAFTQQLRAARLGFNEAVYRRTDVYGILKKPLVCHQLSRIENFSICRWRKRLNPGRRLRATIAKNVKSGPLPRLCKLAAGEAIRGRLRPHRRPKKPCLKTRCGLGWNSSCQLEDCDSERPRPKSWTSTDSSIFWHETSASNWLC